MAVVTTAAFATSGAAAAQSDTTGTAQAPAAQSPGSGSAGSEQARQPASAAAVDFASKALQGSVTEVNLAKEALQKSEDTGIERLATRLVHDHQRAVMELQDAAREENIPLPEDALEPREEALRALDGLSGADFNRAFLDIVIVNHEQAIALYSGYQTEGRLDGLRQYAKKTLLKLDQHLEQARTLRAEIAPDGERLERQLRPDSARSPATPGAPAASAAETGAKSDGNSGANSDANSDRPPEAP
jgi:putative membrane protein